MSVRGVILDLDGTLVDTNLTHVEAWRRAFAEHGFDVPADRIRPEIGKGGDQLVPALIGKEAAEEHQKALAAAHGEAYTGLAKAARLRVLPGAVELIRGLKDRGVRTVLATSSKPEHLKATFGSCGVDFTELVDEATDAGDVEKSKPAPDLVVAAVDKLGLGKSECVMVGDTAHDATACKRAGVRFWAVACGGCFSADELWAAGAERVWQDPAGLLADLDGLLR